jgi:hypothetical protein
VWPGTPLPLQRFSRGAYRWDGTEGALIPEGMASPEVARGETYLELAALDLDDASDILAFANRRSALGLFEPMAGDWPVLREPTLFELSEPCEALNQVLTEARRGVDDAAETRLEFVAAAQLIRDAFRIWRAILDDELIGDISFESPLLHGPLMAGANRAHHVRSNLRLAAFLDWFFAVTLQPFHPQVHRTWSSDDLGEGPSLILPASELPHIVPLYYLCGLELSNHIATQARYKLCKNERCTRQFVYQDNWSRIKHRDALYCTDRCRNAQNQRDHRRRRAAAASNHAPGD